MSNALINNDYSKYFIALYLKSIGPLKRLTAVQERSLLLKYKSGDIDALHELVINNQYIIIKEVLKFINKGVELLDLIQEANLACISAINNYSFSKGGFKNYLQRNIFRNLQNIAPGFYSLICYPQNVINEINRIYDKSFKNLCVQSLSNNVFISDANCFNYSLLHFISIDKHELDSKNFSDRIEIELDDFEQNTFRSIEYKFFFISFIIELRDAIKSLEYAEQRVIMWYYGLLNKESSTYEEIGQRMSLTRERIRQIHNNAIRKLRHHSRSKFLRCFLELYFNDPELISYEGKKILHLSINLENEQSTIRILKEYIKSIRRITPYPEISNIAEALRNLITGYLEQIGKPCSYKKIRELVYEKYPLLKNGALIYALSTSKDIINLKKKLYSLKKWVFTDNVPQNKIQKPLQESEKKTSNNKIEIDELFLKSIKLTENQLSLINLFLENNGQLSRLKLTVHSRSNHYDYNQLVNSINRLFIDNFNEPLVKEEKSNFFLNRKYIA
ncbi:MAG: sigma-70 family RNA polymerase sigma factor [Candidatus Zhuqueibacterota bacterium]